LQNSSSPLPGAIIAKNRVAPAQARIQQEIQPYPLSGPNRQRRISTCDRRDAPSIRNRGSVPALVLEVHGIGTGK
jgi:hypothetical protein